MFCASRPSFWSCSTSSSALVPSFWLRGAPFCCAVVHRSSQGHSDRLLLVSPRAQSSPSTSLPTGHQRKGHTTLKMMLTQGATWLVVVVRTMYMTCVSVHTRQ